MICLGNKRVNDIYIGNTRIKEIYLGEKLIWQSRAYASAGVTIVFMSKADAETAFAAIASAKRCVISHKDLQPISTHTSTTNISTNISTEKKAAPVSYIVGNSRFNMTIVMEHHANAISLIESAAASHNVLQIYKTSNADSANSITTAIGCTIMTDSSVDAASTSTTNTTANDKSHTSASAVGSSFGVSEIRALDIQTTDKKAKARSWIDVEQIDDVLIVRQVFSAAQSGDILEIE